MKRLRGITWDHPRGFDAMPRTAEAFHSHHPDVQIEWHKRSLHDFGAAPVDRLARDFDLVVLDHPWIGFIAKTRCYLPLDEMLPAAALAELAAHSAGPSHQTYEFGGHQWALAIDAATPSASFRPDLLSRFSESPPARWEQVIELGRAVQREGMKLAIPLGPVDAITVFLSLASNLGETPFAQPRAVVSHECGRQVVEAMCRLTSLCGPEIFELTPVTMMDRMSNSDELVYCPLAYSYNNYSRAGFRPHLCLYADMPALGAHGPRGSHIGGTGLAVSARCKWPAEAAQYAAYVASGACQRGEYFFSGGQPAHSDAWDDPRVNGAANNFFGNTRRTIELAYVRPRYDGYMQFQYEAGRLIQRCVQEDGNVDQLLRDLNSLYQKTLRNDETLSDE
jgi:multiple sugar transport system substrate-binding protein